MLIPFKEHFEFELNDQTFYVESYGSKETDEDGRTYTELNYLLVIDEAGNELDDSSPEYKEIEEHVMFDREYEVECHGFDEYGDEQEIPQYYLK